jgi:integrase
MRQSELLGLRWRDIDFEAGVIHLRHQLSRATHERPARLVPLKMGYGGRDIDLLLQLGTLLRKHKLASRFSTPEDYVFTTEAGTPFYYRNVSARGLNKAADQAGLNREGEPRLSMHDLRHTYASQLILELRLDAVRVAELLGHSKPSFTLDTYTHLFRQAQHSADIRARMGASAFGQVLGAAEL